MIEITVGRESIKIRGHANYAPQGKDIICAGITALTQALVSSIEGLTKDKIQYDIQPGRVDIHYRNLSEKASTLVDSFFIGASLIADEFPAYVRML